MLSEEIAPIDLAKAFVNDVSEQFKFLNDYGFVELLNKWEDSTYRIEYLNSKVLITINLGFKDQALYITIFKVFKNGEISKYGDNTTEHIPLTGFAEFSENNKDWLNEIFEFGPALDSVKLERMVSESARILKKYGNPILTGEKWYNWITNKMEIRAD